MKLFADLFIKLDQTTKTNAKISALQDFLHQAEEDDKLWAIALLTGKRPRRSVKTSYLREWSAEMAAIPDWLFEESYHVVGDLAETIALVLPENVSSSNKTLKDWMELLIDLKDSDESVKKQTILEAWGKLGQQERFVFNKLITGGFRIGVSQKLMVKALAKYTNQDESVLAHRLMGNWHPQATSFQELLLEDRKSDDYSRPYPFYLAYALENEPQELGSVEEWQAEHKWDGIRGQLIVRGNQHFVWSRGEELVTDKYPEYEVLKTALPNGTVIDGEILAFDGKAPLPFNILQKRIGRKRVGKKLLEQAPVCLMAYDLLEYNGEDYREQPLEKRRAKLEEVVKHASEKVLQISPIVNVKTWNALAKEREGARTKGSEGLMLKRKNV